MNHHIPTDKADAIATVKAINRHLRKRGIWQGREGKEYGIDFVTWAMCHPDIALVFCCVCTVVTGQSKRYLPASIL